METIAVYWEQRPKTYGFREVPDLSLLNIGIRPEAMPQWGLWLIELADLDIGFHLILAKFSAHRKLHLYILLEKYRADRVCAYIEKRIDGCFETDFRMDYPVDLISFQGPHFGDRYGIADTAFKALDAEGIPILLTVCSGAAVYMVLPGNMLHAARPLLAQAFELP